MDYRTGESNILYDIVPPDVLRVRRLEYSRRSGHKRLLRFYRVIAGLLAVLSILSPALPVFASDEMAMPETVEQTVLQEPQATVSPEVSAEPSATPEVSAAGEPAQTASVSLETPAPMPETGGPVIEENAEVTPTPLESPEEELSAEPEPEITTETEPAVTPEPEPAATTEPEVTATPSPEVIVEEVVEEPVLSETSSESEPFEMVDEDSVDELRSAIRAEIEREMRAEFEEQFARELEAAKNLQTRNGFSDANCVMVNSNELYCSKGSQEVSGQGRSPSFKGVYAEKDANGDSEVYFQQNDASTKLSDNGVDDVQPSYDSERGMVVWQTLVNEHWQISVHDLNMGVTELISSPAVSNIAPRTDDGYVVWQAWDDAGWEIYSAYSGADGWQVRRITENDYPDISPRIANGIILWESNKDGTWQVFGYRIATGEMIQMSSGSGKNSNPRLMVLWESEEDGAKTTLGYDVETKSVSKITPEIPAEDMPLSTLPVPPSNDTQAPLPANVSSSSLSLSFGRDDDAGQ